jgi:hypothetical protein
MEQARRFDLQQMRCGDMERQTRRFDLQQMRCGDMERQTRRNFLFDLQEMRRWKIYLP